MKTFTSKHITEVVHAIVGAIPIMTIKDIDHVVPLHTVLHRRVVILTEAQLTDMRSELNSWIEVAKDTLKYIPGDSPDAAVQIAVAQKRLDSLRVLMRCL